MWANLLHLLGNAMKALNPPKPLESGNTWKFLGVGSCRSGVIEYGKLEIPNQHRWDFSGKLMELEGVFQQTMFDQRGAAWWSTVFWIIHK